MGAEVIISLYELHCWAFRVRCGVTMGGGGGGHMVVVYGCLVCIVIASEVFSKK